jgi:multiple sugar transport system permease protein
MTSAVVATSSHADPLADSLPAGRRLDKARFRWSSLPLLIPGLGLLAVLFVGPVLYSLYLGFTNLELVGPTAQHYQFTGLTNVKRLIHDPVFHQSIVLTLIFVLGSAVVGATLVGLALALALRSSLALVRAVVGGIVVVSFMLPPVVVSLAWYAASTAGGAYPKLAFDQNADFLHTYPIVIVSAANTWNLAGLAMILFGAALRNIPAEITESARMENANVFQRFFRVTLPLLKPTIVTTMLLMTLLALANFTVVYIMTAGGPGNKSMILPVYSYLQAFNYSQLGYGALIGDAMVVFATILSIIYVKLARQN